MPLRLPLAALAALLVMPLLGGCERPLVEEIQARVQVAAPDLSLVQTDPTLRLRLQTSDGGVDRITVNGIDATYDPASDTYTSRISLRSGLNVLLLEAFDEAGSVGVDTAYALYLSTQAARASGQIPAARTRAAATFTNGRVLVTGGAGADRRAVASAALVGIAGSTLTSAELPLLRPRAGHTATLLGNDVLLVGGANVETPTRAEDFVDTVELVSPLTGASLPVEIEGPAVLRTGHTARTLTLDGRTYVYLYGGWIPAGSSVAETGTVVVLEWVPDERRLIARTPAGGAGSFPPVAGHVQVDVPPPAGVEAASVLYGLNEGESVAAELTWRAPGLALPFDLRQTSVDALATPRTEAAGTPLDGLAVVSGGRSADGEPLGSVEVYAPAARRTFRFPASADLFVPRYGHTATIFAPGRMIVIGGRTASGVPAPVVELYSF